MSDKEFLIDDRCIIPDDIKNMSLEELEEEIRKLESEIALQKKNKDKQETA